MAVLSSNNKLIVKLIVVFQLILEIKGNYLYANGYRWAHTQTPFYLPVVKSVVNSNKNNWDDEFHRVLDQWSLSDVLSLVSIPGDTSSQSRSECKAIPGTIHVCNANYGKTGWSGYAQWSYYYRGDEYHIFEATARLNDFYANTVDKVICHEVGHTLGLGHSSEDRSSQSTCMDYSYSANSRSPHPRDYTILETVYSQTDNYDSFVVLQPEDIPVEPEDVPEEPEDVPEQPEDVPDQPEDVQEKQPEDAPEVDICTLEYQKEKDCKKDKQKRCYWDKKLDICLSFEVEVPADEDKPDNNEEPPEAEENDSDCSKYRKDKDCKKDSQCFWNKDKDICSVDVSSVPSNSGGDDNNCSKYRKEKDCAKKSKNACAWENDANVCIDANTVRRLENNEISLDPIDYDIPPHAILITINSYGALYELRNDDNVATMFHVMFAEPTAHRQLQEPKLRGSKHQGM